MAQTAAIQADYDRAAPHISGALDDDFDLDQRGGFPFRLIAAGAGGAVLLAFGLALSGWSILAAAGIGWATGVALIVAVPFAAIALQDRAEAARARRETLDAWEHDLQDERRHAHAHAAARRR